MNLIKKFYKHLLVILFITLIYYVFNKYLQEFLVYFSPNNEVKQHFVAKVRYELFFFYLILISTYLVFAFLFPFLKKRFAVLTNLSQRLSINISLIKKIFIIFASVYIFIAPLFILHLTDIGTDEATYYYSGSHYYQYDNFMIKFDNDRYVIPKDMFLQNIPLIITKPFFAYSIDLIRYISYSYSMILVIMLYLFYRNNFDRVYSKIYILLTSSFTGFIFLSGTSFGENSAMLFALSSLFLFAKYNDSDKIKGLHIPSLLLSLSIITKIQYGIFIMPSLVIFALYYYLKGKSYKQILYYFFEVIIISIILILTLWSLLYTYNDVKNVVAMYYSVSINSMTYAERWTSILLNVERFFNYYVLIFLPVLFYYFYSKKHQKSFVEKFILLVVVLNGIWFITMKGYNFRFMYFAQFGIVLLSVKPISLFYLKSNVKIKTTVKILLGMLFILGLLQNVKLTANGVGNDYLFSLNGNSPLKTFFTFNRNYDQRIFYDKVNSMIDKNEQVYYIGAEFEVMAFIPNKFYTFDVTTYNPDLNITYIIRTSINDQLDINLTANDFLKTNCEKVFEKGLYSLYKINKQ